MTIAGFEIVECPHCQKLYKKRLIGSFGTYGADFYSDGHVGGGFVPESLNIIKCLNKACGKFFRIQEAPVIAEFKNQCNQCGHGLILFDLSKMNSPYDYKYYYCRRKNKVFSAPSKEYNRQSPEQFHCWQKSLGIKTPYERYIPKKNVYCTSCSNLNIIPFNPEVEKCIECNSGSYLHVKWFDE